MTDSASRTPAAPPDLHAATTTSASARRAWLVASLALVSLPFLFVTYVPATDLPQHVAQVRLLEEMWHLRPPTLDTTLLRTQPWAPNTFIYWPMFLLGRVLAPRLVGKLTVWLLLLAIVAALHGLARRRGRDPLYAFVGSAFLFSAPLYWGFLNFLSGMPFYLWFVWRALAARDRERPRLAAAAFDTLLLLSLYWAHVLWFATAAVTSAVFEVAHFIARRRIDWRATLWRAAIFVPVVIPIARWYPQMVAARAQANFDVSAHWATPLAIRCFAFALLLISSAIWLRQARRQQWSIDDSLFQLAFAIASFIVFAPDFYVNTLSFNTRYVPLAAMLACLSLPVARARIVRAVAVAGVGLFVAQTSWSWWAFNRDDLSGLTASLDGAQGCRRTLGLDYRVHSAHIDDRPFMQSAAWVQALGGGELTFSFTEHDSSLVVERGTRHVPWTHGLEWHPERLQSTDLALFDCYLVDGQDADHARFAAFSGLRPDPGPGYFRLYRRP